MKKIYVCLITGILLTACGNSTPEIAGFNDYIWKQDKFGCKGERADMLDQLMDAKEQLLGMRQESIIKLLGKPDSQELYKRNQKFFVYYLEPNQKCTNHKDVAVTAQALVIRISAMGIANELSTRIM